ncbi:ArsR family transcriptional regulator [Occultella kanbiaonis]|uniref:ArsR family transcriptional regulator n=1 Tax=Occultella kanbiaonis TaxID=2675754 RepID=UPI0013D6A68C|nr:ArsR family transcriptional regulator [Occultella kanbiaonis]
MRSRAPALAPFLRSDTQGQILALLLGDPDAELTMSELSRAVGRPLTSVHQEVVRLVDAGILSSRKVGPARLLRANEDYPLLRPLEEIVTALYGPLTHVRHAFGSLPGIQGIVLFGSWAARLAGQQGATPKDLDILVVGEPSRRQVYAAADEVQARMKVPVNPTIISAAEWSEGSPFVETVRSRPYLEVPVG